jgi:heptosyltransferase-3
MSLFRVLIGLIATPLLVRRRLPSRRSPADPRILVIRRNRMGDMIYTLPLVHALRRHFPTSVLTVACDPLGAPIARACPAVDHVIVLDAGWNPWQAALKNGARLQNYDWVIAAKGGFDRRLALLSRLTNAAIRIGFERRPKQRSRYYTDPVALPAEPNEEHQIDTILRLLQPLGLIKPVDSALDLSLQVPAPAEKYAAEILGQPPFIAHHPFMLMNLSSTVTPKFREEDFIALAARILGSTNLVIGLVAAPVDQQKAEEVALCMASDRITAVTTSDPLELAALVKHAAFLLTPEGGAAHLAAAVGTPALVLWSEGPFKKWYSRGKRHAFVHAGPDERRIPVERVWQALQPFLTQRSDGTDRMWAGMLELPPSIDLES